MELYNIYCGFWGGMKEISVGVCLNKYTWLEIWEKKRKVDCSKRQSEKKIFEKTFGLEKKKKKTKRKKNEKRKEVEVQFEFYCKVSGIGIIWKEKLCSTSL